MVRRICLQRGLAAGVAFAAGLMLGPALAQTDPSLRGAQDDQPLTVQGQVTLVPPQLGLPALQKPANVRRIRATPDAPLRDVDPDPNAPVAPVSTGDAAAAAPIGSPTLDTPPQPPRRRKRPEDDPYGPLGLRAASFLLKPSIEVDFGYDSNPGQATGKVKGASYVLVTPRLDFNSDWDRHELRGSIQGSYADYFGQNSENQPKLNATLDGRVDVTRDTAIDAEARFNLDTLRLGDPNAPANAVSRPLTLSYGATLGVTQKFGDASVRLSSTVDRNTTEGDPTSNYDAYGLALRGAYELSPGLKPFVEVSTDWRVHDVDAGRDSNGVTGKGGVTLDLDGLITGEASVGYSARQYDDPTLRDLSGLMVSASLAWAPTALTTIKLKAGSELAETTLADSSGSVNRTYGIEVSHELRRNLIATASASEQVVDYQGVSRTDRTFDATFGVEYKLSRAVSVKATYAYERLISTAPDSDYTSNSLMVGLRMQY